MSNPFRPLSQSHSPSSVAGVLSQNSPAYFNDDQLAKEEEFQEKSSEKGEVPAWKFWARSGKKKELSELKTQHEELLGMMRELCETIEKAPQVAKGQVESGFAGIAPIPTQSFEAFNDTQREVGGALGKLNGHLELVDANQGRFLESMDRVGATMTAVQSSNENSMQAMDKMRRAAVAVTTHVDQSTERFEKLYAQMEEAEKGLVESFTKLQRQSMMVTGGFALVLVICLAVLGFVVAFS